MGKTDLTGIAILAAVGIVGYGLVKSDFFKGVGEVGEGIGSAVGGTGAAIGDIAGDISQTTGNIADFLNPLGSTGTQIALNIDQAGELSRDLRSSIQDEKLQIADIKADASVDKTSLRTSGQIARVEDRQDFYTDAQSSFLNTASSVLKVPTYNPIGLISNWVSSVVKNVKIPTPTLTGNAIISTGNKGVSSSSELGSSTSQSSKTSSLKSSSSGSTTILNSGLSAASQKTLTSLGVPLVSTASGVQLANPPKTSNLQSKKTFWDKITFWN